MRHAVAAACLLGLAACSGSDPVTSPPLLLRTVVEPPGEHCALGGQAVLAGLDADADGVLSAAEVSKTTYACASPGAALLSRTSDEAAGETCALGGTRVEVGRDLDGDATLDAAEVEQTSLVCRGAGPALPVLTRADPAGAACAAEGSLVKAGPDADGDGFLDDAEVAASVVVCDQPLRFAFQVVTPEDLDLLRRAGAVMGDVVVSGPSLVDVVLPPVLIAGELRVVDNPELLSVSFMGNLGQAFGRSLSVRNNPKLTTVSLREGYSGQTGAVIPGSVVLGGNGALRNLLGLGGLQAIGGSLVIQENALLDWVELRELTHVGGDLIIAANPALRDMSMDAHLFPLRIETIGGRLVVQDNPVLQQFDLRALRSVGGLEVTGNGALLDFWLDSLSVVLGDVVVRRNPLLGMHEVTTGEGLRLVTGSIFVEENASLVSLGSLLGSVQLVGERRWPGGVTGGDLWITGNPRLRWNLFPQLEAAGDIRIHDNAALETLGPVPLSSGTFASLRRVNTLNVTSNAALNTLGLPALDTVDGFVSVSGSPGLPTCQVQALAARVGAEKVSSAGTDGGATCP